jgi:fructosamine-3-kinase
MALPAAVVRWCAEHGFGERPRVEPIGGGCINATARLAGPGGDTVVLKTNASAPRGMFADEADGLTALRVDGGPTVPRVLDVGDDFLLLEDLRPAPRGPGFWREFARRLARLHAITAPRFGYARDNWLGASPQPNGWRDDGWAFFAEQRLLHLARVAAGRGWPHLRPLERICARLRDLVPPQPPALLHGDLWSGNALSDARGAPAIVDPAVHFGWAEAELAMTRLFGGFPAEFYDAYAEAAPFAPGFSERVDLYNLYHLLNHLILFGDGYATQVEAAIARYA